MWERNERSWVDGESSRLNERDPSYHADYVVALTAERLLAAAHQALGYNTSTTSLTQLASPESDSMRAMWKSSSSVVVTDIPDLPSSMSSPERPSPRRIHSAPDLMTPSPITGRKGVKRSLAGGVDVSPKKSKDLPSSRALASVMRSGDKENVYEREVAGQRGDEEQQPLEESVVVEGVREVLFTPSPLKRARVVAAPRHLEEVAVEATYPGAWGVQVTSLSFGGSLVGQIDKIQRSRPLSLRSRIKLAQLALIKGK